MKILKRLKIESKVISTKNNLKGFYGICKQLTSSSKEAQRMWEEAFLTIQQKTGGSDINVRDFLDSSEGQSLARDVTEEVMVLDSSKFMRKLQNYTDMSDFKKNIKEFLKGRKSESSVVTAKDWVQEVDVKDSTPEGLFTKSGETIARELLKESNGDVDKAIKKLTFYKNRAGKGLTNKSQIEKAQDILHKKLEK